MMKPRQARHLLKKKLDAYELITTDEVRKLVRPLIVSHEMMKKDNRLLRAKIKRQKSRIRELEGKVW